MLESEVGLPLPDAVRRHVNAIDVSAGLITEQQLTQQAVIEDNLFMRVWQAQPSDDDESSALVRCEGVRKKSLTERIDISNHLLDDIAVAICLVDLVFVKLCLGRWLCLRQEGTDNMLSICFFISKCHAAPLLISLRLSTTLLTEADSLE